MNYSQSIVAMHMSALLWGLSGVLGALTTLDSTVMCVGRSIFALVAVIAWYRPNNIKAALNLPATLLWRILLTGVLLGLHWIYFFLSISRGSVAIALVTYASAAGLIALGEVLLGWSKATVLKFIAPLLSLAGVYVIAPITGLESLLNNKGLMYGMISAVFMATMVLVGKSVLMKSRVNPLAITLGQLTGAIAVSFPFALRYLPSSVSVRDLLIVVALGVICSAIGQTVFNRALKVVSAATGSVIANMEAPYGVILAALIIGQPITSPVAIGVLLVTLAAVIAGYRSEG